MTKTMFKAISKWQQETFGQATALSKVAHLEQEVEELRAAIEYDLPEKHLEYADCFILLFGSAASDGMDYDMICEAINEKMAINRQRKWGNPDANGVVNHISDV
jgi:hypothetical protein